jgi:hypothetical protein
VATSAIHTIDVENGGDRKRLQVNVAAALHLQLRLELTSHASRSQI